MQNAHRQNSSQRIESRFLYFFNRAQNNCGKTINMCFFDSYKPPFELKKTTAAQTRREAKIQAFNQLLFNVHAQTRCAFFETSPPSNKTFERSLRLNAKAVMETCDSHAGQEKHSIAEADASVNAGEKNGIVADKACGACSLSPIIRRWSCRCGRCNWSNRSLRRQDQCLW